MTQFMKYLCPNLFQPKVGNVVEFLHQNMMTPVRAMRVVIFGNGGVGKTSLIRRYLYDTFDTRHTETVEDEYRHVMTYSNQMVDFTILDTAGTYQFPAMRRHAVQNGDGFIVVYDVTDDTSLKAARRYYAEIAGAKKQCPVIIVGNKSDLPSDRRAVDENSAIKMLEEFDVEHLETSAKDNYNVFYLFNKIISDIDKENRRKLNTSRQRNGRRPGSVQLGQFPKLALSPRPSLPVALSPQQTRKKRTPNSLKKRGSQIFTNFFKYSTQEHLESL